MALLIISLRFLHVLGSILWVGFAAFVHFYLGPAVAQAGPEGGKVMVALQRRGLTTVLPILAGVTLASGFWLYWLVSGGLNPDYLASVSGLTLLASGVLGTLAFAAGMLFTRPAMMQAAVAMQGMASASSPGEREQLLAAVTRHRARGNRAGWVSTILMLLAAAGMGVARYL